MEFNQHPPTIMHVDINSCFATIEQQANPRLRGKPVVVAAYTTNKGCILAASVEAKRAGVRTGMPVYEGKRLVPHLVILPSDPDKYRVVNQKLKTLLASYTPYLSVESIDEMVLELKGSPAMQTKSMREIALEIKKRIREEIGEWVTVSIGIAPNRYLAKVASDLKKPDGLEAITYTNVVDVFSRLKLEQLCGIKKATADRLRYAGVATPSDLLRASASTLSGALHSVTGFHWWQRLHGYEDGSRYKELGREPVTSACGFGESRQKSYGQSFALGTPHTPTDQATRQILAQLVFKMARRLRADGFAASGVGVSLFFRDGSHWHEQKRVSREVFADSDFYLLMSIMLSRAPRRPIRILAIVSYHLTPGNYRQESLLVEDQKKRNVTAALDAVHDRFGDWLVVPGTMLDMEQKVLDRIAFGKC